MSISSEVPELNQLSPHAGGGVFERSREESREEFRRGVREMLGMSAEEFIARLDAGEWERVIDDPDYSDHLFLSLYADVYR